MSDLLLMHDAGDTSTQHLIVIHGLTGHITETWESSSNPPEFWPNWLAKEHPNLSVWAVGYNADKSRWFGGKAMHLVERGANVLPLLLSEPRLKSGELIFVGHSLGGLVIKQIMRVAESQSRSNIAAGNFCQRARKVAFLGTPHLGSKLSNWSVFLRVITRPSMATKSLPLGDLNLRDLNNWYRQWAIDNEVEHLVLMETELSHLKFGLKEMIVDPISADPGINCQVIPVDTDHYNICKPANRNAEVYRHLNSLVIRNSGLHTDTQLEHKVDKIGLQVHEGITELSEKITEQTDQTAEAVVARLVEENVIGGLAPDLFDREIHQKLSIILKSRFFGRFSTLEEATKLADSIEKGELKLASSTTKGKALAWCSRLLARDNTLERAKNILTIASSLYEGDEVHIARAFIDAGDGNLATALTSLMSIQSSQCLSAALMMQSLYRGSGATLQWIEQSGLEFQEFDTDGKIAYLKILFDQKKWKNALLNALSVVADEYNDSPALLQLLALTHLLSAVPDELKTNLLQGLLPFTTRHFPLNSSAEALEQRNLAQDYFVMCAQSSREVGCEEIARYADDYALWLRLMDPEKNAAALTELHASMSGSNDIALRRLPIALAFELNLDLDAIERAVNQQTARTSGADYEAAIARFALLISKATPQERLNYLNQHRQQLERFITPDELNLLEIEALARSGLIPEAEERLSKIDESECDENSIEKFKEVIAVSSGEDHLAFAAKRYQQSGEIQDLYRLVNVLEGTSHHQQLHDYAEALFNRTGALQDAERLIEAKSLLHRSTEEFDFLNERQDLVHASHKLRLHWAWALYREGDLDGCQQEILNLNDETNSRILKVNLAIASGDWESLLPYIESEWVNRESRSAEVLLQVANLAKALQPKRAKDFIQLAAQKGKDDPSILASAYFSASMMGWESEANDWMNTAIQLSDKKGPLRRVSLAELGEMLPKQRKQNAILWESLFDVEFPVFIAAKQLNRTLTDFYLLPALANEKESDLRHRFLIPAFSNVRVPIALEHNILAIDLTVILTLGYLQLLDMFIDTRETVVIPHSTLWWLFSEKQKQVFHQPSRIEAARQLQRMFTAGEIEALTDNFSDNAELALEVGDELAALMQASNEQTDGIVVASFPVHKVSSFMSEEADLAKLNGRMCSCSTVVRKLRQRAVITERQEEDALKYLATQEGEWPEVINIENNAVIYLSGVSLTYLQHTGLLEKIPNAGLSIVVHQSERTSWNKLLDFESITNVVDNRLETAREILTKGIGSGKIKLGKLPEVDSETLQEELHPTFGLFSATHNNNACAIDDRFFNRYRQLNIGEQSIQTYTTLDILDRLREEQTISVDEWMTSRIQLRQAGYIFIPLLDEELDYFLSRAEIAEEDLLETTELKVIRESLLHIKLSGLVRLPRDAEWLAELQKGLIRYLQKQWKAERPINDCSARSNWIIQLIDYQGWSHSFSDFTGVGLALQGAALKANSLMIVTDALDHDVMVEYWSWFEEAVLEPLRDDDPRSYSLLLTMVKSEISKMCEVETLEGNDSDNG